MVPSAWAHTPGLSTLRVEGSHLSLVAARPEVSAQVPLDDLSAAAPVWFERTLGRASIVRGGVPCAISEPALSLEEGDGVLLGARLVCPSAGDWTLTAPFLDGLPPGHRLFLEASGAPIAVLDATAPDAAWTDATPNPGAVALRFTGLGVEHIGSGTDHLAFLLGLLLVGRSLGQILLIATGFTVAHSITLTAAALGALTLSPSVVEPLIALSIAFVGFENLVDPPVRRRLALTFVLGLVHGFGFAGVLMDLGLPREHLALALLCFNGGVELGQAVVVALALPVLLRLRRVDGWTTTGVRVASLAVAAAGLYWTAERVWFSG
jgi:hypothetical protein